MDSSESPLPLSCDGGNCAEIGPGVYRCPKYTARPRMSVKDFEKLLLKPKKY